MSDHRIFVLILPQILARVVCINLDGMHNHGIVNFFHLSFTTLYAADDMDVCWPLGTTFAVGRDVPKAFFSAATFMHTDLGLVQFTSHTILDYSKANS